MAEGEFSSDFWDDLRPPGEPIHIAGHVSLSGANAGGGFAGDRFYFSEMGIRGWQLLAADRGDSDGDLEVVEEEESSLGQSGIRYCSPYEYGNIADGDAG